MNADDRRLRRWYTHFNRKGWNGRLPGLDEVDVYFGACEEDHGLYGFCEDYEDEKVEGLEICIDHRWVHDDRIAKFWLIHEMGHIAVKPYNGHGPIFDNELKRIAALGIYKGIW